MSPKAPKLPGRSREATRITSSPGTVFTELSTTGRLRTVALDAIAPNPRQPRRHFDQEALQALADSIKHRGVLQPPVVRELGDDRYELVAGERRCRAARLAGLKEVDALIKAVDDDGQLELAVLENTAREDLSPVDEARAYASLIEDLGLTQDALGQRVGRSRAAIANHLRLLDLPDEVLDLLDTGALTFAHGRALLLCDEHATRRKLARRAVADGWSTRQLEEAARQAGAPRANPPRRAIGADHQVFVTRLADAVIAAAGQNITIRPTAGGGVTITAADIDAAKALAAHFGLPGDLD
jgi:ParB family chromosome partitioning protein